MVIQRRIVLFKTIVEHISIAGFRKFLSSCKSHKIHRGGFTKASQLINDRMKNTLGIIQRVCNSIRRGGRCMCIKWRRPFSTIQVMFILPVSCCCSLQADAKKARLLISFFFKTSQQRPFWIKTMSNSSDNMPNNRTPSVCTNDKWVKREY